MKRLLKPSLSRIFPDKNVQLSSRGIAGFWKGSRSHLFIVCDTYIECLHIPDYQTVWSFASADERCHTCAIYLNDFHFLITGDKDGSIRIFNTKKKGEYYYSMPDNPMDRHSPNRLPFEERVKGRKRGSSFTFGKGKKSKRLSNNGNSNSSNAYRSKVIIRDKYKQRNVTDIQFVPSSNKLLSSYENESVIKLWNLKTAKLEHEFVGGVSSVSAFHATKFRLTVGYDDGFINQYLLTSGRRILRIGDPNLRIPIVTLAYLEKAKYISFSREGMGGGLILWDNVEETQNGATNGEMKGLNFAKVIFDETVEMLFTADNENLKVRLYKVVLCDLKRFVKMSKKPDKHGLVKRLELKRKLILVKQFEVNCKVRNMTYQVNDDVLILATRENKLVFLENVVEQAMNTLRVNKRIVNPHHQKNNNSMFCNQQEGTTVQTKISELLKEIRNVDAGITPSIGISKSMQHRDELNLILTGLVDEREGQREFEKFKFDSDMLMNELMNRKEVLCGITKNYKRMLNVKYRKVLGKGSFERRVEKKKKAMVRSIETVSLDALEKMEEIMKRFEKQTVELREKMESERKRCVRKYQFMKTTFSNQLRSLDFKFQSSLERLIENALLYNKFSDENTRQLFHKLKVFYKKTPQVYLGILKVNLIVVKILPRDIEIVFLKKAEKNNLVKIIEVFSMPDFKAVIMEKMRGNLADVCSIQRKIEKLTALRVIYEVLKGVRFLNDSGFAHMDINPHTVFIDYEGTTRLVHFGYRKVGKKPETFQNFVFCAPETLFSSKKTIVHENSDVFSAGILLYFLLNHPEQQSKLPRPGSKKRTIVQFLQKVAYIESVEEMQDFSEKYADNSRSLKHSTTSKELKYCHVDRTLNDLIKRMVRWNPDCRCSVKQCLEIIEGCYPEVCKRMKRSKDLFIV